MILNSGDIYENIDQYGRSELLTMNRSNDSPRLVYFPLWSKYILDKYESHEGPKTAKSFDYRIIYPGSPFSFSPNRIWYHLVEYHLKSKD